MHALHMVHRQLGGGHTPVRRLVRRQRGLGVQMQALVNLSLCVNNRRHPVPGHVGFMGLSLSIRPHLAHVQVLRQRILVQQLVLLAVRLREVECCQLQGL